MCTVYIIAEQQDGSVREERDFDGQKGYNRYYRDHVRYTSYRGMGVSS